MRFLINFARVVSYATDPHAAFETMSPAPIATRLLPVLVAVTLTDALCTAVFGSAYGLSCTMSGNGTVPATAPSGTAGAMADHYALGLVVLVIGTASVLLGVFAGRWFSSWRFSQRYRRALGDRVAADLVHICATQPSVHRPQPRSSPSAEDKPAPFLLGGWS